MKRERFDQIVEGAVKQVQDTLIDREADYATDADRLANFKVAAEIELMRPVQACIDMQMKHRVSMKMFRDDMKANKKINRKQYMEKCIDEFNYNLLALACHEDAGLVEG